MAQNKVPFGPSWNKQRLDSCATLSSWTTLHLNDGSTCPTPGHDQPPWLIPYPLFPSSIAKSHSILPRAPLAPCFHDTVASHHRFFSPTRPALQGQAHFSSCNRRNSPYRPMALRYHRSAFESHAPQPTRNRAEYENRRRGTCGDKGSTVRHRAVSAIITHPTIEGTSLCV